MGNTYSAQKDTTVVNSTNNCNTNLINKIDTVNPEEDTINVRNKFIASICELGHNGREICDLLKYDECVIAGSFPLQVMTGNTFKGSDIDIFTNSYDHLQKIETYLHANGYNVRKAEYIVREGINTMRLAKIKSVTTYDKCYGSHTPIQLILLDSKYSGNSMNDYIKKEFDIDFCKIIFDGTNIINSKLAKKEGTVALSSLSERNDAQMNRVWKRIIKYANRGNKISIVA